jgi:hypothetical protein
MSLKGLRFIIILSILCFLFISCNKPLFYGSVGYKSYWFDKPSYDFSISYYQSHLQIEILNDKKTPFNRFVYRPSTNEVYYINDELKQALIDTIEPDTFNLRMTKVRGKSKFLDNKNQQIFFETSRNINNILMHNENVSYLVSTDLKTAINYINLHLPFEFPFYSSGVVLKYDKISNDINLNPDTPHGKSTPYISRFDAVSIAPIPHYSRMTFKLPLVYIVQPYTRMNVTEIKNTMEDRYPQ